MLALGMDAQMARASWGRPSDINRSVGSWGVHEQWVYRALIAPYSTRYIYFENGILTVQREGMDRSQEFHPCFWDKISKKDAKRLRKMEYREYWLDHVPDPSDDLKLEV